MHKIHIPQKLSQTYKHWGEGNYGPKNYKMCNQPRSSEITKIRSKKEHLESKTVVKCEVQVQQQGSDQHQRD